MGQQGSRRGQDRKTTGAGADECGLSRWASRAVVLALAGSLIVGLLAGASKGPPDPNVVKSEKTARPEPNLPAPPKGYAVFISGNWEGQLEPCGCAERQLGGIDRRTKVLATPPESRLLIDAGPLLNVSQIDRQSELKLDTFLRSMKHLQYDAVTLTARELLIARKILALKDEQCPPLLCTNMTAEGRQEFQTVPVVHKNLRWEGKTRECLIMGVIAPLSGEDAAKVPLGEPLTAIKEVLRQESLPADKPADKLVIVLLPEQNGSLVKELCQTPAITVVVDIGSTDEPTWTNQNQRNKALPAIICTGRMGKYVIRLDFAADRGPAEFNFHAIAIEDNFPQDDAILNLMADYQARMQLEDLIGNLPRQEPPDHNAFTGNSSCGVGGCHEDILATWKGLMHAQAMDTLVKKDRQFDPYCVECHAVGMKYRTGYLSLDKTPDLAGVGCEACHGPGKNHAADARVQWQEVFTPCENCHNHETSPKFAGQRETYFEKIKHWKAKQRRYWQ
jgi:hypothetical protein